MVTDPEIESMRLISEALEQQSQEARDRILRWVVDKYGSDDVRLSPAYGEADR